MCAGSPAHTSSQPWTASCVEELPLKELLNVLAEGRGVSGEAPGAAETSRSWAELTESGYSEDLAVNWRTSFLNPDIGRPGEARRKHPLRTLEARAQAGVPHGLERSLPRVSKTHAYSSRSHVKEHSGDGFSGTWQLMESLKNAFFPPQTVSFCQLPLQAQETKPPLISAMLPRSLPLPSSLSYRQKCPIHFLFLPSFLSPSFSYR